jgi:hypothetical protein
VNYLAALALTVAVEAPLALLGTRGKPRGGMLRDAVFLNLFTHPLAWTLALRGAPFWPLEAGVAAVEALSWRVVSGLPWGRAGALSLLCNGATAGLSLLLR